MNRLSTWQTGDGKLGEILDDVLSRMARGEEPDIDAYACEHPEVIDVLKHALPAIRAFAVSIDSCEAAADKYALIHPDRALGDFHIVRELGRGGMGVVYEAQQTSLGRNVALKILPFAGMVRENALQRFQNEVRAAAALDHPNIVSVYSIGQERGVHYYAMQLIRGQTLADVIRQLGTLRKEETPLTSASLSQVVSGADVLLGSGYKDEPAELHRPTSDQLVTSTQAELQAEVDTLMTNGADRRYFSSLAQLGIQAAEALQHAHDNGVLHRDVKPSNLMLDADSNLYVTDFGLARIETDAAMTMTGDLIGTLRYMSPEQALGKRVVIDQRSDVYSLGATLYELVALQPAFVGENRQELLNQIAQDEPAKLRSVDTAVPREFETIVHKALAKDPDERYATAGALGDDLRAFCENRPIKAKPPTPLQRASKWAQRHQRFAAAAMAFLLTTTISLGGSTWMVFQEKEQAEANFEEAERQRANAEAQRVRAETERKRAEANFIRSRDAVDRMFTQVAEDLKDVPHLAHIRRALLEDALEFYQEFLEQKRTDPEIRHETATAYASVARIHTAIGQNERAENSIRQAILILENLSAEYPADVEYGRDLSSAYGLLAHPILYWSRPKESAEMRRKQLMIARELVADFPREISYRKSLAYLLVNLGTTLRESGKIEQASVHLRQALAEWEQIEKDFPQAPVDRRAVASAYQWYGALLVRTNRLTEAKEYYDRAALLREEVLAETPDAGGLQARLAHIKGYQADLLRRTGNQQQAERRYREAIGLRERLSAENPFNREHRRRLSVLYRGLGGSLHAIGRLQEAEEAMRRGLRMIQDLRELDANGTIELELARQYHPLGCVLLDTNQLEPAANSFRHELELFEALLGEFPDNVNFRHNLARFLADCPATQFRNPQRSVELAKQALHHAPSDGKYWNTLGIGQYRCGDWSDALAAFEKSDSLTPDETENLLLLAMAHHQLGHNEDSRHHYERAAKHIEQMRAPAWQVRFRLQEAERLFVMAQAPND